MDSVNILRLCCVCVGGRFLSDTSKRIRPGARTVSEELFAGRRNDMQIISRFFTYYYQ